MIPIGFVVKMNCFKGKLPLHVLTLYNPKSFNYVPHTYRLGHAKGCTMAYSFRAKQPHLSFGFEAVGSACPGGTFNLGRRFGTGRDVQPRQLGLGVISPRHPRSCLIRERSPVCILSPVCVLSFARVCRLFPCVLSSVRFFFECLFVAFSRSVCSGLFA